jgi:serine protease Do
MNRMSRNPALSNILRLLILPAALGLLAGAAGGLAAFSELVVPQELTSLQPRRPPTALTQPLPETEIAERLEGLNLPIYPRKVVRTGEPSERAVLPEEAVGTAAVLTSDGWLMTHQSVLRAGRVVIGVGQKLLEPKDVIVDARTGIAFLRIENGPLPVSGFEETEQMRPGVALYLDDGPGKFRRTAFSGLGLSERKNRPAALRSSDEFSRIYRLDAAVSAAAQGGAVLTIGGNLAGIIAPEDRGRAVFIPAHLIRGILSDVFKKQVPERGSLGVNYLDLADVPEAAATPRGFLLTGHKKSGLPAVRAASAAEAAGLRDGDVIIRLGDVDLLAGRDLAEEIAEYRPGAKVKLEALRAGSVMSFEIVLE